MILMCDNEFSLRNERGGFENFLSRLLLIPGARSPGGGLTEPYRSLAFYVLLGQRPVTSLSILQIMLKKESQPLIGKQIGQLLAQELKVDSRVFTSGRNYEDRIASILRTLETIGILEKVSTRGKKHYVQRQGYRIALPDLVRSVVSGFEKGEVMFPPHKHEEVDLLLLFKTLFDDRIGNVLRVDRLERFEVGKIVESLLDPKVGIDFYNTLRIIMETQKELKPGMNSSELQHVIFEAASRIDPRGAERYLREYPEPIGIMVKGVREEFDIRLMRRLIYEEARSLSIHSASRDEIINNTRLFVNKDPKNQNESTIRESLRIQLISRFIYVSDIGKTCEELFSNAMTTLDQALTLLRSGDAQGGSSLLVNAAGFVVQRTLLVVGILPFKDERRSAEFLTSLLRSSRDIDSISRELRNLRESQDKLKTIFNLRGLLIGQVHELSTLISCVYQTKKLLKTTNKIPS